MRVQGPDRIADRCIMGVDQQATARCIDRVTGEMNLLHAAERQPIEKSAWIKTVVVAVDVDVVDVEQYAASRLGHDRGQELPLAEFIAVKTPVDRHVLEPERPAERVLPLAPAAPAQAEDLRPAERGG